ncbi:MAG: DUF2236 domain-containing protein [Myxococcaceae bacterium]|nr:DUF2236 domain-containing protein [Myxococcaceae bacterium]
MRNHTTTELIARLDPVADHSQIYYLFVAFEFPWDVQRALELAMCRSFCVPSISALLHRTGEFRLRAQKRYDDTAILMAELAQHGYDSPRGAQVIDRINRIHSRFAIANDDFKYVLSTFVFEPIRWIDRYGWRHTASNERLASFHFYREVGRRMGIEDIPDDYCTFESFNREYERARFCFAKSNRQLAEATRALFCSWFPFALRPLVGVALAGVMDDPMLQAFGLTRPPWPVRAGVACALRLRAQLVRHAPRPRLPRFVTAAPPRTYPAGYTLEQIGPPEFLRAEREAAVRAKEQARRNRMRRHRESLRPQPPA